MRSKPADFIFTLILFLATQNILSAQTDIADDTCLSHSQADLITRYVSGFPGTTQI